MACSWCDADFAGDPDYKCHPCRWQAKWERWHLGIDRLPVPARKARTEEPRPLRLDQ